jgi:tRNA-2-methylthio-N6-dimethylallyladenosine synthase
LNIMETEKNGRRFFIQTFGCQMNVHDSAAMAGIMAARGYGAASGPEEADLIIVNTCSVRERAYQKVRSAVGALRRFKDRRGRGPVIVVAGCVARQEGERWLELCPHVDIVMGPDGLVRLADLVRRVQKGQGPVVDTAFDEGRPGDFASPPVCSGRSSAYVTVSKGCSGACSFCIVPFLRGPERCRPAGDVVRDVAGLAAAGVKEVCLLGQTVNSWSSAGRSFADLLAAHMHLPVQSGSNRILRRMNRGYSADDYLRAVDLLRRYRPDLALSTDMIVGFPGETDEDFERTLELVRRVGFDTMFSFKYSPRPGTAAADWADDVPAKVKQARLEALHDLADESTAAAWAGDLGRRVEVLVEGRGRRPGQLSGRTRKNRIVNFSCGEGAAIPQPGDLAAVRIHEVLPHSLRGILAGT